ncbi:synaptonemal complex protein 1 isoform X2 [Paroedura picta]|uniref:synaptonemal complex protein 1 isoform X2 n=1 Tax=Paroedura picta TaxID=143630 RepID=UPI004056ABC4
MEQDKSFTFKLFIPPRLNNAQVSAVKPQKNTGHGEFIQDFNKGVEDDYNLPFVTKSTSKHLEDMGHVSQKVTPVPEIDQENMETMTELYSKLYKEAEKIKRWKVRIEYEVKEKERKLQEDRKIIEALRKAIQELQFENERLSLKLEDEMYENKVLLKESNATRRWCNLLKETCAQSLEKSNKYEHEREETRQMYVELNNNTERMILAFEELRVQAENSRLEMYFKLKEEAEKMTQLENEYKREMDIMEKQVSALIIQSDEKDNKVKDISIQLQDSRKLITELEEIKTQQWEMLKEAKTKEQGLLTEAEETKSSLQKAESACKGLDTELQTAVATIIQLTEQKERTIEELKETREMYASITDEFQATVSNLKELLEKEENRQKELRDESAKLMLELQKKSTELDVVTNLKNEKEKQVEEMVKTLENSVKIQKDLEYQLECERSEKNALLKEEESRRFDDSAIQVQIQELLDGKQCLEETIEKLQEREKQLNNTDQIREKKIHDLETQLAGESENKQSCLQQLTALKAELEKEQLKNDQLNVDWNKLLLDKEHLETEKNHLLQGLKNLQEEFKDSRKIADNAGKQLEILEETNIQLRNELESLKEKMKMTDKEAKNKLDTSEENVRNTEKEMLKKEKQLKTLENKINSLKKQIENKTKHIEELQQEVTTLQLELENITKMHKVTVDSYRNEIEMGKATEKKLLKEVEKIQSVADEATAMKKVLDIQCQHKIMEMVVLMEKHKHQYDKTIEEKDTELEYCKTKEQQLTSSIRSLENELACQTNKLSSLQEQLKREIEEKENLAKEAKMNIPKQEKQHKKIQTSFLETPKMGSLDSLSVNSKQNTSQNFASVNVNKLECTEKSSWTPAKTYTVKTPPKLKLLKESTSLLSEEGTQKKRKVFLELDNRSESSESNDLLSITSEQEKFKKLYKDYPQASRLCIMTPKKVHNPSSQKATGSSVKSAAMRKIRDAGWTAVSKMDRRKKMKEAGKLFT